MDWVPEFGSMHSSKLQVNFNINETHATQTQEHNK